MNTSNFYKPTIGILNTQTTTKCGHADKSNSNVFRFCDSNSIQTDSFSNNTSDKKMNHFDRPTPRTLAECKFTVGHQPAKPARTLDELADTVVSHMVMFAAGFVLSLMVFA